MSKRRCSAATVAVIMHSLRVQLDLAWATAALAEVLEGRTIDPVRQRRQQRSQLLRLSYRNPSRR
jgi:hypothetical protein